MKSGSPREGANEKEVLIDRSRATSSLGLRKRYLSDLPNLPNTKLIFPLSQIPKLLVACVMGCFFACYHSVILSGTSNIPFVFSNFSCSQYSIIRFVHSAGVI